MRSILKAWGRVGWPFVVCASVLVGWVGASQAQPRYSPYLAPQPFRSSYSGYVASQGLPLQDGQPIAVEYDPSGKEIGTIALDPGTEIVSSGEWNAWVEIWRQAIADREAAGGLYQELTRSQFDESGRQCLDEDAQPVSVSSQFALATEVQSVLVASVFEGIPPCAGYVLATVPLALPIQPQPDDASLLVDGDWSVLGTSQVGGAFGYRAAYFDAEQSGCPEDGALPAGVRNLVAFQNCPSSDVQSVYAPVSGAVVETLAQSGGFGTVQTDATGRYQLPFWYYAGDPDSSLWVGRRVTAKVTFSRIEPRLPSSRFFTLRRLGSGRTLHFPIDTVTLRAQARLGNPPDMTGEEPSTGVTGFLTVPVVDLDYAFDVEFTQYSVNPGSTDRTANQGLVKHISAQDLRETDIYIFRAADDKLVGERRGMSPLELSGIAAPSQYPNATVPSGCEGFACLSFVVVTRGPALVDLDQKGPVGDDGVLAPFASDPPGGQPGLEVEYPESPNTVFLRPGDLVRVVAINRATGYTGMELGRVYVDSASAAAQATGQAGVGQHLLTVRSQGLSVIADASDPQQDLRIDMYPPNLRVRVNRQYDVERGATAGEERNYIVGFEGSALNTDDLITVRTEWFAPDGSPLPAGLPGLTGRLARVREGVLQEVGVVDAAETNVGEFPISPGVQVSVAKLPEGGVDKEHLYLHIDGSPSVGTNDFAGRAGISRPDFSVGEVCYFSTGTAEVCFQKQSEDPSLQSRPAQFVPFQVPIYDKDHSEAQRAAFLEQDLEDPGPVYRWPYRPEMQFSVHDLEVEDVYRVEEDGTEVSVIQDDIPILTATNGRIDYTLDGPLDSPLPAFEDIDGDGQPDSRAFGWEFDGRVSDPFLPDTGQQQLLFESLVEEGDGLEADDFMALSLFQLGDEANVLWEFVTLDFTVSPDEAIEVSADDQIVYLVARVYVGDQPADDGSEIEWTVTRGPDPTALSAPVSLTEDGLTAVILRTGTDAGVEWEVRADLTKLLVGGRDLTVPNTRVWSGTMTVVPGAPASVTLTPDAAQYTATLVDEVTIEALVKDQHGNEMLAGTPVEWRLPGYGFLNNAEPVTNAGGVATAKVTSGYIEEVQAIQVHAGKAFAQLGVPAEGVSVSVQSTRETVDLANDELILFRLSAADAFGTPVPDGTPVRWLASIGTFAAKGETTVNGRAQAVLEFPEGRVGAALLRASVGGSTATKAFDVTTSSLVRLEVDHPLLAGDQTPEELEAVDPIGEPSAIVAVEQLEGGPRPVPFYAEANLVVTGVPNDIVKLRVNKQNESDPDYVTLSFAGSIGAQEVDVQLDAAGRAEGFISSTGVMFDDFEGPYPLIAIEVLDSEAETRAKLGISVAPCMHIVRAEDVLWAALTGEASNAEELAAAMAASLIPGIDLGNMIVQLGRVMPGGEEPDWVSFGVSSAGLAVDTVPAVGQAASVPITFLIAILKQLPSGPFRKGLGDLPGEILERIDDPEAAIEVAGRQADYLEIIFDLTDEERLALNSVISSERSGTVLRALTIDDPRVVAEVVRLASTGDFSPRDIERALLLLEELDEATAAVLRSAEGFDGAFEGITLCMKNGLDPGELKAVLANKADSQGLATLFTSNYDEARFLKDLGDVADVAGAEKLLVSLKTSNIQNIGRRYELEIAVALERQGVELVELSRAVSSSLGRTDIDIFIRMFDPDLGADVTVAIQAKRSRAAFGDGAAGLLSVQKWVRKVQENLGVGPDDFSRILYYTPPGVTIPPQVRDWFTEVGIRVVRDVDNAI